MSKRCAQRWLRWMLKMKTKWVVAKAGANGYWQWSAGDTVVEALNAAEWIRPNYPIALFLCSEDAHVDTGYLFGTFIRHIGIGKVGSKLGRSSLKIVWEMANEN